MADGRRAAAAGQLAVAALLVGSAATVHALWGIFWQDALVYAGVPFASLPSMNLGLAVGSVALALVVVAVPLLVVPGRSRTALLVTAAVVVAVLLRGLDALRGPESNIALMLVGAAVLGLMAAALLARVLPGRPALRWPTAVLLGAALGVSTGIGVLAVAPLLAPLGAATLVVALLVSAARVRRARLQPAGHDVAGPGLHVVDVDRQRP